MICKGFWKHMAIIDFHEYNLLEYEFVQSCSIKCERRICFNFMIKSYKC
jgi:hypothetical protein